METFLRSSGIQYLTVLTRYFYNQVIHTNYKALYVKYVYFTHCIMLTHSALYSLSESPSSQYKEPVAWPSLSSATSNSKSLFRLKKQWYKTLNNSHTNTNVKIITFHLIQQLSSHCIIIKHPRTILKVKLKGVFNKWLTYRRWLRVLILSRVKWNS
jgi:hypothetical protein